LGGPVPLRLAKRKMASTARVRDCSQARWSFGLRTVGAQTERLGPRGLCTMPMAAKCPGTVLAMKLKACLHHAQLHCREEVLFREASVLGLLPAGPRRGAALSFSGEARAGRFEVRAGRTKSPFAPTVRKFPHLVSKRLILFLFPYSAPGHQINQYDKLNNKGPSWTLGQPPGQQLAIVPPAAQTPAPFLAWDSVQTANSDIHGYTGASRRQRKEWSGQ